jgi:ribulose-5-phosphate 4-epimerase/fuculose-1-phosphate aldolase
MDQGTDLAQKLARNRVVLMRGHGCAVAGPSVYDAVHTSVYLKINAGLQSEALKFGEVTYLSPGEIERMSKLQHGPTSRAWEYWKRRCGDA